MKPTILTIGHETKTLAEWVALHGVPASTIRSRIALGWSLEQAVSVPSDRRFKPSQPRSANGPRLRAHKGTGQAFCEWETKGERHIRYFGKSGTTEAADAYTRFTVEWVTGMAQARPLAPGETVYLCDLVDEWVAYCEGGHDGQGGYQKHGRKTSEYHLQKSATNYAVALYGETPVTEFGAEQLRAVRKTIIDQGLARRTVNGYQTRIVQMFGWGVGKKLVPADVWTELKQVELLERGKTTAPDRPRRRSAPWSAVEAVFPHLHKEGPKRAVLEAMIRFHWLIGCRPQDVASLTPVDLDRAHSPWLWTVEKHKNEHRDQQLTYWVGPRAQAILAPLLVGCPDTRQAFGWPHRRKAGVWRPISRLWYGRFVKKACQAAGVDPWTPHQIRKARATEVMREYEDVEAAVAAIGDSVEVAAKVYIDPTDAVSRQIAK
jgi:integrase